MMRVHTKLIGVNMFEHIQIDDKTCVCGFTTNSYRGLNSHIGNTTRNKRRYKNGQK